VAALIKPNLQMKIDDAIEIEPYSIWRRKEIPQAVYKVIEVNKFDVKYAPIMASNEVHLFYCSIPVFIDWMEELSADDILELTGGIF